jgi:hypothetical protein
MRALLIVSLGALVTAACTPEIVSGSYLCGPNATCPDDQVCNGPDNVCVSVSAEPFSCAPDKVTEPDDTTDTAYSIGELDCVSIASVIDSCMDETDPADWIAFSVPAGCGDVVADVRVTFPTAFEELALELWDLDANERVAVDAPCPVSGEGGDELRCLKTTLAEGARYAIQVVPTGEGTCDGDCAYNRYTLRMQLNQPR